MTTTEHDPDRFATGRRFPTQLDPPATGAELGEPVKLYSTETQPWPVLADAPAVAPPVVASGPGDRVGWLLCGRRGGHTG